MYDDPSTGNRLYLQGVFPLVNGMVDHRQAYARVGNFSDHYNINGNVVPLSGIVSSNTCGQHKDLSTSPKPPEITLCPN